MKKKIAAIVVMASTGTVASAWANNVEIASEAMLPEGIRFFDPLYFEEFDPVSALDLVQKTPGFNPEEQSGGRGLSGVRSNILINGVRPPPKGQSATQQLGDIPYTNVSRIELIDTGSESNIDMQGYRQVVNVVLADDADDYYEFRSGHNRNGSGDLDQQNDRDTWYNANGLFSWGDHSFSLRGGLSDHSNQSPPDFVDIDPASPSQRLSSISLQEREEHNLEFGSQFRMPGNSTLIVNAETWYEERGSRPLELSSDSGFSSSVRQRFDKTSDFQEVSAEYRRPMGTARELMLAIVDSRFEEASESSLTTQNLQRSSIRNAESGESAARVLYSMKPIDQLTLRTKATLAYNYFEGDLHIFTNGVPVALDGSDSLVEEDRYELEVEADYMPWDRWTLRGSVSAGSYEINTLEQSTGSQVESKGYGSVAWQPIDRTTLTWESRRHVGQLSFNQFLASTNLSSEILQAGAGNLEAERSWIHSLNFDRRFGDRGVLSLRLSQENLENPVRSVPVSDSVVVSRNANPETVNRFEASLDYPFERFNMKDLVLELGTSYSDSHTIDPVSGEVREVTWAQPYHWSIGLRRNPGEGDWAWGFNLWSRANNPNYWVRSIRERGNNREWRAWVQWEFIDGVKVITRYDGAREGYESTSFYPAVRAPGLDPTFIATTTSRREAETRVSLEWRRWRNIEITATYFARPEFNAEEELVAYGDTTGGLLTRQVADSPRFNVEFRLFTQ